jgi:uncharacterized RDD family membrane protein YckC
MTVATPAGFWRRYTAYSLDFAALGTLATLLAWSHLLAGGEEAATAMQQLSDHLGRSLVDALMQGTTPTRLASTLLADPNVQAGADAVETGLVHMLWPWLLWYAVLAALYHIGFEHSPWQGSPGKHALGLVVVTAADDGRPSLSQIVVRHCAGALSWLTLNLGHALAALPPQKRALHDYLAGTRVLCRDDNPRLPGWARAWLALQVIASVALLAWMLARYVAALQQASLI